MNKPRWKVSKTRPSLSFSDKPVWLAYTNGLPLHSAEKVFHSHAEALAYADRIARARTVVLPRISDTRPVCDVRSIDKKLDRVWMKQKNEGVELQHHFTPRYEGNKTVNTKGMFIPSRHVEPLALALLAHHYKENQ